MQKIKKKYNVIPFELDKDLVLDFKIDLESEEDLDSDGLTNKQEFEFKTNPLLADSDMDGLDDYYELFVSKTNPNNKDTDNDGLNDYDEVQLGLNPLVSSTYNDGIKDGDRELNFTLEVNGIKIEITGKGNIASTIIEVDNSTKISKKNGLIDKLFTFNTEGELIEGKVSIPYITEELEKYNIKEEDLSLYYYDTSEDKYGEIETIIDFENKTLIGNLNSFSHYVVGNKNIVKEKNINDLLIVLDNSWSLYTNEQYKEITGKEYDGGIFGNLLGEPLLGGYDSEGKRFSVTKELISSLSNERYRIGLSEFRKDYANALPIGSDINSLNLKLDNMNGKFITEKEGTDINNALKNGIDEFTSDDNNKFILILTDGEDSSLKFHTEELIQKANSKNVMICAIAFSEGSYNIDLTKISNETGCAFYSSSNVNGLKELFENVKSDLKNDLVDFEDDGKADGILLADSGFIVNRDGFSFPNYVSNLTAGHCYGMATFAQLYYSRQLPLKFESKMIGDEKLYAYNLRSYHFRNYSNLYDYNLKTNDLKYVFGFDHFGENNPANLRIVQDGKNMFSPEHSEKIKSIDFYDTYIREIDKKTQKANNYNYSSYERVLLNEDKMQTSSMINSDDKQLLNAIQAAFMKQDYAEHYSSSSNLTTYLRNLLGVETIKEGNGPVFINILKTRLQSKDAPVIVSSFSGGLHAVNAISLVQDINNPNYYYIGVYDNNYPGEKRYVNLECKKDKCVTKVNLYYPSSEKPIRITPSLEFDLQYYN